MDLFNVNINPKAIELANSVLHSGWLNEGKYVGNLESRLKTIFNFTNPISVNSCTSALHLALLASGVSTGDEVILSPQTFVASGISVLMCGANPVFSDIDPLTGCLDPEKLEEKITDKTKAVIFIYWGGNVPFSLLEISKICKRRGLFLIEDAAHAFGSKIENSYIGSTKNGFNPDFTCFSFQAIKFVTSGDGGILCVHSDSLVEKLKRMKWFGLDKNAPRREEGDRGSLIAELGFKYNMNDLTAAIALGNLENIEERIAQRIKNALFYKKNLCKVEGLNLLEYCSGSCHWIYTILVENRSDFIKKMKSNGIPVSVVDRRIDEHPIFGGLTEGLTGQELFDRSQVSLPVHDNLLQEDLEKIVKLIKGGW